jgi:MFS family permease
MKYWEDEFSNTPDHKVTSSQQSLIVSILSAGTFFGALFAAPIADRIGRRLGLMFSAGVVFNLGVILQTASTGQSLFVAGRFFAGLGVGLVSAMSSLSPPSRNETSTDNVSSNVSIRDLAKMDSRNDCRILSVVHYHWSLLGRNCEQLHAESQ